MHLFDPITLRSVTLRNRVVVSPMCEYSSTDGFANAWHFVHLGSRAVGGAGLVLTEAAAVSAEGRISPQDLGIYLDEHVPALRAVIDFIHQNGAVAGIQLAHAGFKASTAAPWNGGGPLEVDGGGWRPVYGPTGRPFKEGWIIPEALTPEQIAQKTNDFAAAAKRALDAGFRVIELHAAHGYLLHEFLSPASNQRSDEYGGSFENRTRFLREVISAVRSVWPDELPLFVRISASDWIEHGWQIEDSVRLAVILKRLGVDVVDASSGGISPDAKIAVAPGYQVPFASRIKKESDIATCAVGMITQAQQAQSIIERGDADLVMLARELLRQPYWPLLAAAELGRDVAWPPQYERAKPS
ncbi:MAG: NADH:flavin oxidoreductase/NADH oxidase [Candidatus Eremiobacteraeota bacterium]|nr:NADH:flavin oxidoreductase/NADH oxidase [Candidatus Eremiobacteraeota bacterium]